MAQIGQDLAKIRKKQAKSLEDIHDACRIPISVLSSIEDGSIFSEIKGNKTMIRSNVRSFARVLKIDDQLIIDALNRLEKNEDSSFLVNYEEGLPESLGQESPNEEATKKTETKKTTHSAKTAKTPNSSQIAKEEKKENSPNTEDSSNESNEATKAEATTSKEAETTQEDPKLEKETEFEQEVEESEHETISAEITNSVFTEDLKDVDWEQLNKRTKLRKPANISWISVFFAVIFITLGALYFAGVFDRFLPTKATETLEGISNQNLEEKPSNWLEENNNTLDNKLAENTESSEATSSEQSDDLIPPQESNQTTSSENTENTRSNENENNLPAELAPEASQSTSENTSEDDSTQEMSESNLAEENNPRVDSSTDPYIFIPNWATTLPNELEILVYAATNNLAPVRLQWDGLDQLRPYWVEVGQAMRVKFSSELRLRTLDYDRMILIFNGHPIGNLEQQFYNEEDGLLIVPRSFFENDESFWLNGRPASADFDDIQRPDRIYDRPTF